MIGHGKQKWKITLYFQKVTTRILNFMGSKLIKNKYIAHEPHESVQSSVSTFQTDGERERENQKVGGMTKSGTEKKRIRRAGAQNAGKDSSDNNSKVRYNLPRSFP